MNHKYLSFLFVAGYLFQTSSFLYAEGSGACGTVTNASIGQIGDLLLTEDQMRKDLGLNLYRAEENVYQVKKAWVEKMAKDYLFNKAAKDAKMSRKDWDTKEIDSQVAVPTDSEVQAFMIQRTGDISKMESGRLAQLKQQAAQYLLSLRRNQRETTIYQQLVQTTPLTISLQEPVQPKVDVAFTADNPSKGPKDAPVTIIEFTDFQCPWCQKSQESVKAVEKTYEGKIKLIARQLPLTQIHPRAFPAAEAAFCAKEQGKFWEYRDKLFEKQELQDADFTRYAKELKLKEKKFAKCVETHKYTSLVQADMNDAQRYGVTGTPTFFVNGTQVGFNQLMDTVKAELDKKK